MSNCIIRICTADHQVENIVSAWFVFLENLQVKVEKVCAHK
jgi:hypothetical protein